MINEQYKKMLEGKSVIRQLSEFATARGKEIAMRMCLITVWEPFRSGTEKFKEVMIDLLKTKTPWNFTLQSQFGIHPSRKTCSILKQRFDMDYTGNHIFPQPERAGAVGACSALREKPGISYYLCPLLPGVQPYINMSGAILQVVPANKKNFQINFEKLEKMLNEKTAALLIIPLIIPPVQFTVQRLGDLQHS